MKDYFNIEFSSKWAFIGSFVFAFFLYGNTLNNKYCLDDSIVIEKNRFTQEGVKGIPDIFTHDSFTGFFQEEKNLVSGGRYRPLSIATFAAEYEIFGGFNPKASHFINILFFAITVFLIYLLMKSVSRAFTQHYQIIAIISALLFLFHPVHTEVVANIKGRDELLALMFSLWACWSLLLAIEKNKKIYIIGGALLWFLALISKENAMVFLVLMPLMLFVPAKKNIKSLVLPVVSFAGVSLLYVFIRISVLGSDSVHPLAELLNNSYLGVSFSDKMATIVYTLGKYLLLLIFPHPLTHDYYPYHITIETWNSVFVIISLFIYIGIIIVGVYYYRSNYMVTIASAFYLIPLIPVSNLFFPIGTFMGERFIYFSSLGFCIGIAFLFVQLYIHWPKFVWIILPVILFAYSIKTINRNNAWYNDFTLFTTDVKISHNSAKVNCAAGGIILDNIDTISDTGKKQELLLQSRNYLKKALSIHPLYADAQLLLGNWYFKQEIYDSALICYTTILRNFPKHENSIQNILGIGNNLKLPDSRIAVYDTLLNYDSTNYIANYQLGLIYGKEKGNLQKAIYYLVRAHRKNPDVREVNLDLGVAYGMLGNYSASIKFLEAALALDPNNPTILTNLGISYRGIGDEAKARIHIEKAQKIILTPK